MVQMETIQESNTRTKPSYLAYGPITGGLRDSRSSQWLVEGCGWFIQSGGSFC